MVSAWYMDNETSDQRLEHHRNPKEYIKIEDLLTKTGVEYIKISDDSQLDKLKKERGYTYEDEIVCSEACLPNYEEKIKSFYMEHLHTDEEIRYILDGTGYFDVRDNEDQWIRIAVGPGDLIILPGGIYHRFTLDTKNYIKAKRYFIGEPVWKPYNRPADHMECRREYVGRLHHGFANFPTMAETLGIIVFALWYIAIAVHYAMDKLFSEDGKVQDIADDDLHTSPAMMPNKGSILDELDLEQPPPKVEVDVPEPVPVIEPEPEPEPVVEPEPQPEPEPEPEPEAED